MSVSEVVERAWDEGVFISSDANKKGLLAIGQFKSIFDCLPVFMDDTTHEKEAWAKALELSTTPLKLHEAKYSWEQLSEAGMSDEQLRRYLASLFGYQRLGLIEWDTHYTSFLYVASFIQEPKLEIFRPASNGVSHMEMSGVDLIKEIREYRNVNTDLRQGVIFDV